MISSHYGGDHGTVIDEPQGPVVLAVHLDFVRHHGFFVNVLVEVDVVGVQVP